jgi:DNA-directed RNA polymerase subunit L
MTSIVDVTTDEFNTLRFTLKNADVSVANAIRRTILTDIPCPAFVGFPHEKDETSFITNTSKYTNEILKHRLGCIPIRDIFTNDFDITDYYVEVNVENKTGQLLTVTTKDFVVKHVETNEILDEDTTRQIFPPYYPPSSDEEYYIVFVKLKPSISAEIPGEKIHFRCNIIMSTARLNSSFNVTSACSYGYTVDKERMLETLDEKKEEWKVEGKSEEEIFMEGENWKLLDGKRICVRDSFDFIIQTIGVFTNEELVYTATDIIVRKLNDFMEMLVNGEVYINPSFSTIQNSYEIILKNDDYTIGKLIEYMMATKYFNKSISFCGYIKMHPHDEDSIIRVALTENIENPVDKIEYYLSEAVKEVAGIISEIRGLFKEAEDNQPRSRSSRSRSQSKSSSTASSKTRSV